MVGTVDSLFWSDSIDALFEKNRGEFERLRIDRDELQLRKSIYREPLTYNLTSDTGETLTFGVYDNEYESVRFIERGERYKPLKGVKQVNVKQNGDKIIENPYLTAIDDLVRENIESLAKLGITKDTLKDWELLRPYNLIVRGEYSRKKMTLGVEDGENGKHYYVVRIIKGGFRALGSINPVPLNKRLKKIQIIGKDGNIGYRRETYREYAQRMSEKQSKAKYK